MRTLYSCASLFTAVVVAGCAVPNLHPAEMEERQVVEKKTVGNNAGSGNGVGEKERMGQETEREERRAEVHGCADALAESSGSVHDEIADGSKPYVLCADITFYTPWETCPGGEASLCTNAAGKRPTEGISIACPRRYRLGTKIRAFGGDFICDDRTALKYDGRFDIFIADYALAKEIGIQETEVLIRP